jgi:hypothetical protein
MQGLDDITGAIVDAAASTRRDPGPGTVGLLIHFVLSTLREEVQRIINGPQRLRDSA